MLNLFNLIVSNSILIFASSLTFETTAPTPCMLCLRAASLLLNSGVGAKANRGESPRVKRAWRISAGQARVAHIHVGVSSKRIHARLGRRACEDDDGVKMLLSTRMLVGDFHRKVTTADMLDLYVA